MCAPAVVTGVYSCYWCLSAVVTGVRVSAVVTGVCLCLQPKGVGITGKLAD